MESGEKQMAADTYVSPSVDYIGSLDELTQGGQGSGTDSIQGLTGS